MSEKVEVSFERWNKLKDDNRKYKRALNAAGEDVAELYQQIGVLLIDPDFKTAEGKEAAETRALDLAIRIIEDITKALGDEIDV